MNDLRKLQGMLAEIVGPSFVAASDHPYGCTCGLCRDWWLKMGPEDGSFGPFGDKLWEPYAERHDMTVEAAKAMHEE